LKNRNTFKKDERISYQKEIEFLFAKGKTFITHPFRAVYVEAHPVSGARAAVLISVPKKKVRRAVNRNQIKRHVRETYRQNKSDLHSYLEEHQSGLLIAFIFIGKELPDRDSVESSIKKGLEKIKENCYA
jgi:ribonuclease P protein component